MKTVSILSSENCKLSAVYNEFDDNDCVIMCHGIKGNKTEKGNFLLLENKLNSAGISSIRFDFRAHNESEGEFVNLTVSAEIQDFENVINFAISRGKTNIILLGVSFGGSIVALLDFEKFKSVSALIFWYPALRYDTSTLFSAQDFKDAETIGYVEKWNSAHTKSYKFGKEFLRERKTFKPWERVINCSLPKLFLHGDADKDTDLFQNSIQISAKSPNSKLKILNGLDHCFVGNEKVRLEAINITFDFIKSAIKKN